MFQPAALENGGVFSRQQAAEHEQLREAVKQAKHRLCLGKLTAAITLGVVAQFGSMAANAYELYNEGDTSLDFNFIAMYA